MPVLAPKTLADDSPVAISDEQPFHAVPEGAQQASVRAGELTRPEAWHGKPVALDSVLKVLSAAAGVGAFAYALGAALVWLRYQQYEIPATAAVALVEPRHLVSVGAGFIAPWAITTGLYWGLLGFPIWKGLLTAPGSSRLISHDPSVLWRSARWYLVGGFVSSLVVTAVRRGLSIESLSLLAASFGGSVWVVGLIIATRRRRELWLDWATTHGDHLDQRIGDRFPYPLLRIVAIFSAMIILSAGIKTIAGELPEPQATVTLMDGSTLVRPYIGQDGGRVYLIDGRSVVGVPSAEIDRIVLRGSEHPLFPRRPKSD